MARKPKRKERRKVQSARNRAEKRSQAYEGTAIEIPEGASMFKLAKEGVVRLDILPYEVGKGNPYADEGELHYERTFHIHRGIGANEDTYVCPQKSADSKCPICDFRKKLATDPDSDEDLIKDLAPKERQLFNVIDLNNKDKGVQIWDVSYHLFGKKLDAFIKASDEEDGYDMFADLEEGFTLRLGIEEQRFGSHTFYAVSSIEFKPRKEAYDEDILEEVHCLDSLLKIKPYDELKDIFMQVDSDDDEEEEEETPKKKSSKRKPAPKKKAKKAPVEDDDDDDDDDDWDDEDDDDDEEDEEETPKKKVSKRKPKAAPKKKSKKAPVVEEDEDDDDDWDDWEDEDEDED